MKAESMAGSGEGTEEGLEEWRAGRTGRWVMKSTEEDKQEQAEDKAGGKWGERRRRW